MKNRCLVIVLVVLMTSMFLVGTASAECYPGEDYFGYTWIDSVSSTTSGCVETTTTGWIELNEVPNALVVDLANKDDNYTLNGIDFPPGFQLNFYGRPYGKLNISNNGLVFGSRGNDNYSNVQIGETSGFHNFIAPFWDDIVTWNRNPTGGSTGKIYASEARDEYNKQVFVVEWEDNQHYTYSDTGVTFEAILYPMVGGRGSNITFRYKNVTFGNVYYPVLAERCNGVNTACTSLGFENGGSATIGIEGPQGQGLQYSFNGIGNTLLPYKAIRFQYPQNSLQSVILDKDAPPNMPPSISYSPTIIPYTIYYSNINTSTSFSGLKVNDTLPPEVEYVSTDTTLASTFPRSNPDGSTILQWNLPNLPSGYSGTIALNARIRPATTVGSNIINKVKILDNADNIITSTEKSTVVNQMPLPPNVDVGPIRGSVGGTPSINWGDETIFTYYSSNCPTAANPPRITIIMDDGKPPIEGDMSNNGTNKWEFRYRFLVNNARHGAASIEYKEQAPCTNSPTYYKIFVDPAGYVYDASTGARIWGATVLLLKPLEEGGWDIVEEGQGNMDPDVNHLITNDAGQYQWNTIPGTYRVYVTAPGYYSKNSRAVTVPPEVKDLHVGLTPMQKTGSLGVGVAPRTTTASTKGTTIDYTIKIRSVQNFNDRVKVNVTVDGLPASYQMPLYWFDWDNRTVNVGADSTVSVPLRLTIPPGEPAGRRAFKVRANSTFWITTAYDSGIITIS